MCILCAFRGQDIGVDTISYLTKYNSVEINNYSDEFIFYNIAKLHKILGFDVRTIQILMTIITYIPLSYLTIKYIRNSCLAILVFIISTNGYYFETFNIVRQSAATMFLMLGYVQLNKRQLINASIFFIIAFGFHNTSIFYILLILVAYKIHFSNKFMIYSIIVSLIFAFTISNIEYINNLISQLSALQMAGTEKYSRFTEYELQLIKNTNGLIVMLIPFSALCVYAYNYFKNTVLMRGYFIGVILLNIISIMPTSYRMAYGLISIEILLYPMIFASNIKYKWIPTVILFSLAMLWIWKLQDVLTSSSLIPYKTF